MPASPSQTNVESPGSGTRQNESPVEVQELFTSLKRCLCAMGGLVLFRLLCEIYYIMGALAEVIVACFGVNVLLADPAFLKQFPILSKIPDLKKSPPFDKLPMRHGLQALIPFMVACVVGILTELRHTLYMKSANATNLEILIPILVYVNVLVYASGFILALKLQCASFTTHSGNNYATTDVANANVGHPDSLSDDDDQMRVAMEASRLSEERRRAREDSLAARVEAQQREALQGLSGPERVQAVMGNSPSGAAGSNAQEGSSSQEGAAGSSSQEGNEEDLSEEEKIRRAQEASMKQQMEEARLRRQNEYRASANV